MRAGSAALLALALLGALATRASAAAPEHPRRPSLDVEGLNHACGVATDSQGDLYLSNAGEEAVEVYGPADHEAPLGEIANPNEPCGVALTSTGTLYVSEQGTGEVVRYLPEEFPFAGAPSYGEREVIDASGEARGISVDPFDDRLYVAAGTHVSAYDSEGNLGTNEVQRVNCFLCTGGSYKLIFGGEETEPIAFEGPAAEVEGALEALPSIGKGNVSVENEEGSDRAHLITFVGELAHTDVESLTADPSGIEGAGSQKVSITEPVAGFNGLIGEVELTEATGVAAYTYEAVKTKPTYHLAVADDAADQLKLFSAASFKEYQHRRTLPEEGEEALTFGAKGAYLGSDAGSCPPEGQACTAGHFFFYDDASETIEEYEASGELLSQTPFEYGDAQPTAVAVDRSGSEADGTLYVTTGAGAGARALAFDPLAAPSRPGPEEPPLSLTLPGTRGIDVDVYGNRYVAAEASIAIYGPTGEEPLLEIEPDESEEPRQVKVDSECNVYARLKDEIVYYSLSSCPPTPETTAGSPVTVSEKSDFEGPEPIRAIGVNPANDRLFVTNQSQTIEFKSAKEGSGIVDPEFGPDIEFGSREAVATCEKNGHVYVSANGTVFVLDKTGNEILTRITGVGSPSGSFGPHVSALAVDQSNCHLFVFEPEYEEAEEFDSTGAFVGGFGSFTLVVSTYDVAVDNGPESPNQGTVYVAFDDPNPEVDPYDLTAFGGLLYGQKPLATTGLVTEVDAEAGEATLNGTVGPNGFKLEGCHFEYLTEAAYEANLEAEEPPFAGAEEAGCEPEAGGIGTGTDPVPVEARIGELNLEGRYRFGLVASNEYGASKGEAGILGPPLAKEAEAKPILYDEATLHARLDPSGLPGEYRFQYLTEAQYEANLKAEEPPFAGAQSTPQGELGPADGFLAVEASLEGLAQGTSYRFQVVADNDAGEAQAEGQFTTLEEPPPLECPNSALRTGPAAALPDCRAYELVSPGQTGGYVPYWGGGSAINGSFPTALATADGQSMVFMTEGPLPGTNGNGVINGYRAQRGVNGWGLSLYGPTPAEISGPRAGGVSADHDYSLWTAVGEAGSLDPEGGVEAARYLALPEAGADPDCGPEPTGRFELIGCGSLDTDPEAIGRWISPGAEHVIFTSDEQLEPDSPAKGKTAIYDRSPGGATHVVSLLPGGKAPSGDASYRGVSADGSAVAFTVGGALYVRHDNAATLEIGTGLTFAGLARDGSALFYLQGEALYRFDTEGETSTQIAPTGDFVNVAAEGTGAYFTSSEELAAGAEAGKDNLYLWEAEGDATSFVAILDPADLEGDVNLGNWVKGLDPNANGLLTGPATDPSRSSADGKVLLFESHAPLTGYESAGHTEVFRYEAAEGDTLACLSCGPEGTVVGSDATLQDESPGSPVTSALAPIANLSKDGQMAFFSTAEPLLPADRNGVADVYGWRGGRLALISTGQSGQPSYLYAVSASGGDVFFATREALVSADEEEGGMSLYDARVEGGFPAPAGGECEGESCLESATAPPELDFPPPTASQPAEGTPWKQQTRRKCPKGKRRVKRKGRVRCVKRKGKRRRHRAHRRHRRRAR